MTTRSFSIPELAAAQAQKHVTVNEALRVIDAAMNLVVTSRALTDPPANPGDGAKYIPASPAGGVWAGRENEVAAFVNGLWRFFSPEVGWRAFDQATGKLAIWDGAEWSDFAGGGTQPMLGINTNADATNRLAVKSEAVLFSYDDVTPGSGDIRFVINKLAAGNTASLLFQTGYSGRGEIGLAGSDALEMKASADGIAFDDALSIDPIGHNLRVTLNGAERGRWTDAGLGIGTTSPGLPLDVAGGAVRFRGAPNVEFQLQMVADLAADQQWTLRLPTDGSLRIRDANAGTEPLLVQAGAPTNAIRILANGNVGIGSAVPSNRLEVSDPEGVALRLAATGGNASFNISGANTGLTQINFGDTDQFNPGIISYAHSNDSMLLRSKGFIVFQTGGAAERMRIDGNGNVGIGTTVPTHTLDVVGTAQVSAHMDIGAATGGASAARIGAASDRFWIAPTDRAGSFVYGKEFTFDAAADGIWTAEGGFRVTGGTLRADGVYTSTTASAANVFVASDGTLQRSTSSAKYKTDIQDMTAPERDVLNALRPVSYLSTCGGDDPKRRHFGLIAEEVFEVSPSLVHLGADGAPEGVMYERIVPHLIAGHKNHEARIAKLHERVEALEAA
ncbi:DUF2793 domain-containing protein [Rhizobiales bacterium]|uniref:DUF2793 domain-containing protein n=1 Tax=Hongsoonwoonella zoysiae TaxID=2821844 RepID=UPI0015618B60|nr:DUF2793 domain-containing protein [Hongsoonwoonella zoysiae]NRG18500.1 DUF2793 domain-containing protein [Hongsoonwoonella zoysiae]